MLILSRPQGPANCKTLIYKIVPAELESGIVQLFPACRALHNVQNLILWFFRLPRLQQSEHMYSDKRPLKCTLLKNRWPIIRFEIRTSVSKPRNNSPQQKQSELRTAYMFCSERENRTTDNRNFSLFLGVCCVGCHELWYEVAHAWSPITSCRNQ